MKLRLLTLLFIFFTFAAQADDTTSNDYNEYPWAVAFYHGTLVETSLLNVFTFDAKSGINKITTGELDYQLSPNNILRKYLSSWVTSIYFVNNVGYVSDPNGPIYEYDPFFLLQWRNFPWDKYIVSTFGIGWGVSYDTRVTAWEQHDSDNTKKLLNYLDFETTLALPRYPQWQFLIRLHHRSGVFGLYGADNAGSNYLGAGIRYNFTI